MKQHFVLYALKINVSMINHCIGRGRMGELITLKINYSPKIMRKRIIGGFKKFLF